MKKVALKLSARSVPNKIEFAGIIVLQMAGNPFFTTPNPTLASITTANTALDIAYKKAQVGGAKDFEDMRAKEIVLDQLLTAIGNYVEYIANLNPANTDTIILSAGMSVKTQGTINISTLSADKGNTPNSVKLRRKSGGTRVAYKWQYSKDPFTDISWIDAGESTLASFEINDLEPLKRYWFRVAIVKGSGQGEYTNPVTFVIS